MPPPGAANLAPPAHRADRVLHQTRVILGGDVALKYERPVEPLGLGLVVRRGYEVGELLVGYRTGVDVERIDPYFPDGSLSVGHEAFPVVRAHEEAAAI